MLLEISGEITPERMKNEGMEPKQKKEGMEPKQKQYPVVDATGDRSKIRCCKSNIA